MNDSKYCLAEPVIEFFNRQLEAWPMAKGNFEALKGVKEKTLDLDGLTIRVQFNPARIVSSGAKVDKASLSKRPCFLCEKNRPAEQFGLDFGDDYTVLINPFPIFPRHFTIPLKSHSDQLIAGRIKSMAMLAKAMEGYTVFYNGPRCGASAPDHMHFQAGNSDFLTLDENLPKLEFHTLTDTSEGKLAYSLKPMAIWTVTADSPGKVEKLFDALYKALPVPEGEKEPMLNLLCSYDKAKGLYRLTVIPRKKHRPSFYGMESEDQMLLSPASVDMGGVFITPLEKDFNRLDANIVRKVLDELCLSPEETLEIAKNIYI